MEINYQTLRQLLRMESEINQPNKLPVDFYERLEDYITHKREEILSLAGSFSEEAVEKVREFFQEKRVVLELLDLRVRKIMERARTSAKTGVELEENLVGWEKDFYHELVRRLKELRERYETLFELPRKKEEKKEEVPAMVRVRILKDIPQFIGTDLKEYGPFYSGQVLYLPKEIAELLERRGLVEVR